MFPVLHDDVSRLLEEDNLEFNFYKVDKPESCIKEHDTNIMGRFICHNHSCESDGWSSKNIAITIRMYDGKKYNARVYHQRCMNCNSLSRPYLDGSYAERVAYRLKKWNGIKVEAPDFSGERKKPHHRDLCEGCKDGHCKQLERLYI